MEDKGQFSFNFRSTSGYNVELTSVTSAHRTKDFRRFIPFLFMYGLHPRHPFVRCSEIVVAMQ